MGLRHDKVVVVLKREISNILHDELKDKRLGFVTVTRAELTPDLRYAKIFYSVLGEEKERENTKKALDSANAFIRRLIAKRIELRFVPEIVFKLDRSVEYSVRIQEELDKLGEQK
jgi:ribosome-binding factor A